MGEWTNRSNTSTLSRTNWMSSSPVHYRSYSPVRTTRTSLHSVERWSCRPGLPTAFTGRWLNCTLGSSQMLPHELCRSCRTYPVAGMNFQMDHLRVGSSDIAASVRRAGINYLITVEAPVGWCLTIGYTLPVQTQVKSVRLNGSPASFQIVLTNRGEEIRVLTNSGGTQELLIQAE